MKKLTAIAGILTLVGAAAVPVLAWGPGSGWGHHRMMGYGHTGSEYGRGYDGNLTAEQKSRLEPLDRKFYDETRDLRGRIWTKSRELETVLSSSNPDLEEAKDLQKEITGLSGRLDEKRLQYELEARKIVPDQAAGSYGYGRHMGGYGSGGNAGFCWN